MESTDQANKKFTKKTKGAHADKGKAAIKRKKGLNPEPNRGKNPKAFTRPSDGTHKVQVMKRKVEVVETSLRLPTLDVSYSESGKAPPLLVAVVGPPQSGKSTLIRSLVKLYTNKNLTTVRGPITVIGGKTRRLTFFECPSTLHAMCDVAKVADVVIMMVDASYGFEMETFEFLNMALVHGMPRILGVLTHLDKLRDNKALKRTKKVMRHRFWQEVAQGSKLFYLTGMERGMYKRKEIVNLNHFLLVTKPMEQKWKANHPYIIADRFEDITPAEKIQEDPMCGRDIAFFGYVRGKPFKTNQPVHIPGVGDLQISHVMWVKDPCHAPSKTEKKTRSLSTKEKRVYAPMADMGDMTYDDDAVYVKVDDDVAAASASGDGHRMLSELRTLRRPAEHLMDDANDEEEEEWNSDEDGSSDNEEGPDGAAEGPNLFACDTHGMDSTRVGPGVVSWGKGAAIECVRDMFVTGKWTEHEGGVGGEDGEEGDVKKKKVDKGYESVSDEEGEAKAAPVPVGRKTRQFADTEAAKMADMFLEADSKAAAVEVAVPVVPTEDSAVTGVDADYWRRKKDKKSLFDEIQGMEKGAPTFYEKMKKDAETTATRVATTVEAIARDIDSRIALVGYFTGLYVRMVLRDVPVEFTKSFHPDHPLIVGGLLPGEDSMGIMYARVKRHRWYRKILKANDPVVLSVGWRRFQTQPIYATEDCSGRQRYLKYTPKHMHCIAAFYGPLMPPNTGVCSVPSDPGALKDVFRVIMTGYTMEVATTSQIVKKLKIVGTPEKICKNTAFIKDMFNSSAEAAKFEGTKLRTVSGIRGAIKKAVPGKEGLVRCSFEDKILKSDIVFLRAFTKVEPQEYYNPVTNLLTAHWQGMRNTRAVRLDRNIPVPTNDDCEYLEKPVHNKAKERPFFMPSSLTKVVPFESKVAKTVEPVTIGIPRVLRSELAELSHVTMDEKDAAKLGVLDHFRGVESAMRAKDDETRVKKRAKADKVAAEDAERKDRAMKKFKKEHSKLMAFRKPQKRTRSAK